MSLGKRIRNLRKEHGMTLKDLAVKTNMSEQAISQYEREVRKVNLDTLKKIAIALNVPIENLLIDENIVKETYSCKIPNIREQIVNMFAETVIGIGIDKYKNLTYKEMENIAFSEELYLFLEYIYLKEIRKRYEKEINKCEKQLEKITNKKLEKILNKN